MKKLLVALLLAAAAVPSARAQNASPAYWQGPRTPGNVACYQNTGSGTTLQDATVGPCNMTTTNSSALNNGLTINSGYTGAIDNSAQLRYLNRTLYGAENCSQQMYKFFDNIQGFFAVDATCATIPAGTAVHQFIPGLFSIDDYGGTGGGVPVIAQSVAEVSGRAEFGVNTLHVDSPIMGTSSSSTIAGTVLTVGGTVAGVFQVGDWVIGTGVTAGTQITSLGSGTGGAGTYNLNLASTVSTATRISDHLGGITGTFLQDELDFFALQPDTKSRLLIDGYFPNGAASSGSLRNGVAVGLFTNSAGHWQNAFQSAPGAADVALQVGATVVPPSVTGETSQQITFIYTDNTSTLNRLMILNADPTNAGATGADLILSSSYGGPANLSIPTGSVYKVGTTAGVSCPAGTVNLSTMVVTAGIITHC